MAHVAGAPHTPRRALLERARLGEHYDALVHTHGLEACDLPHVTEQDLLDAGMAKVFHRKRFLRLAAASPATAAAAAAAPPPNGGGGATTPPEAAGDATWPPEGALAANLVWVAGGALLSIQTRGVSVAARSGRGQHRAPIASSRPRPDTAASASRRETSCLWHRHGQPEAAMYHG